MNGDSKSNIINLKVDIILLVVSKVNRESATPVQLWLLENWAKFGKWEAEIIIAL